MSSSIPPTQPAATAAETQTEGAQTSLLASAAAPPPTQPGTPGNAAELPTTLADNERVTDDDSPSPTAAPKPGAPIGEDEAVPATADDVAPDPVDEAKIELMRTRFDRAAKIREDENYDGRMTVALLVKLQALHGEGTPKQYVRKVPATIGKDYESTGLTSSQYQTEYMNDVYTIAHWRALLAYTHDGTVAHAHVVLGNNLGRIKLDAAGDLVIPDDAEILVHTDGWGGHTAAASMGDRFKSGRTNSIKRVLAELGIAGDVYRQDVEAGELMQVPEHLLPARRRTQAGPASSPESPRQTTLAASANGNGNSNGGKPAIATTAQIAMLCRNVERKGLSRSAFANLVRAVYSADPVTFATDTEAQEMLDRRLPALRRDLVQPLLNLIKASTVEAAPASAPAPPQDPSAAKEPAGDGPAADTVSPAPPPTAASDGDAGKARMLAQHARDHGLTATALAHLLDRVHSREPRTFAAPADAVAAVTAELPVLDDDLVVPLADLITATAGASVPAAAQPALLVSAPAEPTASDLVAFDPTAARAA